MAQDIVSYPLFGKLQVVGFFIATLTVLLRSYRLGHKADIALLYFFVVVCIGALGGTVLYFLIYPVPFSTSNSSILVSLSSVVVAGTLIHRLFPSLPYEYSDRVGEALPLWQMIGKVACYFAGCCSGSVDCSDVSILLIFPLQMVESFLLLCVALFLLCRRVRFEGENALLYIVLYSTIRCFAEFFREEEIRMLFGYRSSYYILISLIVFALFPILTHKKS